MSDPTQAPSKKLTQVEDYRSKDGVRAHVFPSRLGGDDIVVIEADTAAGDDAEVVLNVAEVASLRDWLTSALPASHEPRTVGTGQTITAQQDETGRLWRGPRGALPKGYSEISYDDLPPCDCTGGMCVRGPRSNLPPFGRRCKCDGEFYSSPPPPAECEHEWSAIRRVHTCLKGCGAQMSTTTGAVTARCPLCMNRTIGGCDRPQCPRTTK